VNRNADIAQGERENKWFVINLKTAMGLHRSGASYLPARPTLHLILMARPKGFEPLMRSLVWAIAVGPIFVSHTLQICIKHYQ
jgi:hypothetical protein